MASSAIEDPRVQRARFPVWLARDMTFNTPGKGIRKWERFSEAQKIPYGKAELAYLRALNEKRPLLAPQDPAVVPVAIRLGGCVRYVWRCDVLTKAEYDGQRRADRDRVRGACAQLARTVGAGNG